MQETPTMLSGEWKDNSASGPDNPEPFYGEKKNKQKKTHSCLGGCRSMLEFCLIDVA